MKRLKWTNQEKLGIALLGAVGSTCGMSVGLILLFLSAPLLNAGQFVVASFNLENFVGKNDFQRPVKTAAAREKIVEAIMSIQPLPDVLAVQEIGQRARLDELQKMLKAKGLNLQHSVFVDGPDPVINLAVLSRFPMKETVHRQVPFLLGKKRRLVSRGFAEVEVRVAPGYSFMLFNAHLKSKRPVPNASEAALRLREAEALRALVDQRLAAVPGRNLIVVGDLNDTPNATPIRALIARGKRKLVDLRPAERNGDKAPSANRYPPRRVTWTTYYGREDSFTRFDYLLASPGMAKELVRSGTYVLAMPDWGVASDHRPVVATFHDRDE